MTLRVTIGGTTETNQVLFQTLTCNEIATAGGMVATASFDVKDESAAESFAAKEAVVIDDSSSAPVYFKGEIAGNPEAYEYAPGELRWRIECQDYNQLLVETVVTSYSALAGTLTDAAIVDAMVSAARGESDIDSSTYVVQLVAAASMEDFIVVGVSLAEALTQLCGLTGGRFYVDFEKNLHYYATSPTTETDGLSDAYDDADTFRYWGLKRLGDVGIVNSAYIIGKEVSAWVVDATSVSSYGSREVAVTDQSINGSAGVIDLGTSIVTTNKDGAVTYELLTQRGGLDAGHLVELTSSVFSLSAEALLLLKKETTFLTGTKPVYKLTLGDDLFNAPAGATLPLYRIGKIEKRVWELDVLAAHGWTHDLVFSATDNDTVEWASGNIYLAGGVGTLAIDAGNTGNMAATTHIYYDADASATVLQTDTDAGNCVGANKILIGVAKNVAAGKDATFYTFGGEGDMGLIVADNIAAATIVADLLAANCITAAKLEAVLVLASEITAGDTKIDSSGITMTETAAYERAELSWDDGSYFISIGAILTATEQGLQIVNTDGEDAQYLWLEPSDPNDGSIARISVETFAAPYIGKLKIVANELYLNGTAGPKVFINETVNTDLTAGLTISQGASDDQIQTFKSSDVGHAMTDLCEADTFGSFQKAAAASGGLLVDGWKDDDGGGANALILRGALGEAADTTKSTSGSGVINLVARITDGSADITDVGSNGNLAVIRNNATTRFIFDAEGSAHGDVEWVAFDDYDDLALLDKLESTVTAQEFGSWADDNRAELERLGIAYFDDTPGHAMVNWTRLSMLLVGALKQTGARLTVLETRLLETG